MSDFVVVAALAALDVSIIVVACKLAALLMFGK